VGGGDEWDLIRWRGAVHSAMCGQRGQAFLKEMLGALDALPEKKLIAHDLIKDGEVCAIGSVGLLRGYDMSELDPDNSISVATEFDIADALVREIEYINDEDYFPGIAGRYGESEETPTRRFTRVREWLVKWTSEEGPITS